MINKGLELLQKASNLSDSFLLMSFSASIDVTTLAPTGYPLVIPMARGKEAHPGTLNNGRIIGSSSTPTALIKFVLPNTSEATIKGNIEGKTTLSHRLIPCKAELTAVFENIISDAINTMHNRGNICNFHEKRLYLPFEIFFSIIKYTPLFQINALAALI